MTSFQRMRATTCVALLCLAVAASAAAKDGALLVAPQELHAGGASSLTVTTFEEETRTALARPVVVRLLRGGATVATLFEGDSGAEGHVRVAFDVPGLEAGNYVLEATIGGVDEPLQITTRLSHAPAILIETDKPIYKPGQTIQGRVLLVSNALTPVSGEVELSVHDAKGIRVDRRQLSAGEFGAVEFSLDLASEVNYGVWKLKARADGVESVRDIRVEEYTLPRFEVIPDLARPWAFVDEPISGVVSARYFFGEIVNGAAVLTAKRWVGEWEEYARVEGELQDGSLAFELPPVEFVAGTPGDAGQGGVTLDIEVIDSTGHSEATTEVITITRSKLLLALIPRVSSLKPEMPFEVEVTARDPDGSPLDASVAVAAEFLGSWGNPVSVTEKTVTVTDGRGVLELVAPPDASYAELSAHATYEGRTSSTSVRIDASYSSGHSFLSLVRADGDETVDVGSEVTFIATSTHSGTLYYEVYAGGRTVFSEATTTDSFSFVVTPEMLSRARVVAYKINPDNEVAADSASFKVNPAGVITVTPTFDQERVAPGDAVELTIDAGTGHRTLLGVAIVDASVLALGQSRLHLAEVFAELERRFLEPQAEVHEAPGEGEWFFDAPRAVGPLDVLHEAGLDIATTAGISVPEGGPLWDWDAVEDGGPQPPPQAGGGEPPTSGAPDTVRVRQYFPETWVWEPLQFTDESGQATLSLTAPDTITTWKLSVVGSSPAGLGFGAGELTVFQEFFVEPSLPYSVTRGEEFPVKVDVFNYLDESQDVQLSFTDASWLELLGDAESSITIAPRTATAVEFPIRPTALGVQTVEIMAIGSSRADAVRREIIVEPEGVPAEAVVNGVIEPGSSIGLDVSFPPDVVPGSQRASLNVTPSPVAQTMNGVSDLLGMPYGCGEQNMIFLAPDIEILRYLNEIGELSTEIRAQAEYYVNVGYQRELTFQSEDGGFAAFGGETGSLWLTAFVLSTFSNAREVRDIDEGVLAEAAAMLAARQRDDGAFELDTFLIHTEMLGGVGNLYSMAAFVTNALADYAAAGTAATEIQVALERAAGYLRDARSSVADESYPLALAAVALGKVPGFETETEAIIDRLIELAIDDGPGLHWEPYPVETTGYAAMALLSANGGAGRPQAAGAVDWLSTQRNALGGYGGSTQDTVVAIRTLFQAARKVNRDLEVTLTVTAGDETIWSLAIDSSNFDVLHTSPLPIAPDGPALMLRSSGTGNVGYQVSRRFNLPGEMLPPPKDMLIEVDYDTEGIEVDDILDVRVRLLYAGAKEATGMVIADIGVPTGFEVVRASTDALIEAGVVSRVEHAGRKVIFYVDSLMPDVALEFAFEMRALYPVRSEGPVSRVYEYYDDTIQAFEQAPQVIVTGQDDTPNAFRRGDTNVDGSVDLSDAVATLDYLFAGMSNSFRCADAADANDDGKLNITDPIYLLGHLFAGGPPPAEPYAESGLDPTADDLDCRVGL